MQSRAKRLRDTKVCLEAIFGGAEACLPATAGKRRAGAGAASSAPTTVGLGQGPAGDDGVDLGHDADGFGEGDDDFLVMINVVGGEFAAFAILEPLFADLIAADVEIPEVSAARLSKYQAY